MNEEIRPFFAGAVAGVCGAVVGQPFETIKIRSQLQISYFAKTGGLGHVVRDMFRGLSSQIAIQVLGNCALFGVYESIKSILHIPHDEFCGVAAGAAGVVEASLYTTLERIKSLHQCRVPNAVEVALRDPLKGAIPMFAREIPGNVIYLGTFSYLTQEKKISAAWAGGAAGLAYWSLLYPIDVWKSHVQMGRPLSFLDVKSLYRGFFWCVVRSVPVSAAIFHTYDKIMKR